MNAQSVAPKARSTADIVQDIVDRKGWVLGSIPIRPFVAQEGKMFDMSCTVSDEPKLTIIYDVK